MSNPERPPFEEIEHREFSFYPPILGIEHNGWRLKEATWSEVLVVNTKIDLEVAVPRRYFGQVSQVEEPVVIVGLTRELEYRTGAVWPTQRKMLSLPGPVIPRRRKREEGEAEERDVSGLRRILGDGGPASEAKIGMMIATVLGGILVCSLLVWALVEFTPEAKPTFVAKDQSYLELSKDDDYHAVLRHLGAPSADRWRASDGEIQYRALAYKNRGYTVILMGTDRDSARYIGTMSYVEKDRSKDWRPLHYVEFTRGATTASLLRNLPKF